MNTQILVSAQGLSRSYGVKLAVDSIDLELRKGEVLGLLGPNGAGKTTTLQMLAGCLAPSAGKVEIKGINMRDAPARAKREIGYLPERPPLYPELTVDEYLRYCARLHRIPSGERKNVLESAKQDCGLTDVSRRIIGNLSKGYQQRVGIAQAILHRPDVVILDEPTVGLDPNQIREIRSLITRLGQQHSVLLSSHILPEIQATCSRVVIINHGQVVFDRAMDAISEDDTGTQISLGLLHSPGAETLAKLPDVENVTPLENGFWRLQCKAGKDPRNAIAERATAENWGLFELHASQPTLEDIFADLTIRETPTRTPEARPHNGHP